MSAVAIFSVVLMVVLCLGGLLWNSVFGSEPTGAGASTACKRHVEDRLTAPATARYSDMSLSGEGRRWTVTGKVDAENRFGVPIRMRFRCVLVGDSSNWRLIDLNLTE